MIHVEYKHASDGLNQKLLFFEARVGLGAGAERLRGRRLGTSVSRGTGDETWAMAWDGF